MPRIYQPKTDHPSRAYVEIQHAQKRGIQLESKVPGEVEFYPLELSVAAAGPAVVGAFAEPVRTVKLQAVGGAVFVARSADQLAVPADGSKYGRVQLEAGAAIDLPWGQDEIHAQAGAVNATLIAIGLI